MPEQGDVAVIREALEVAERNAVTMMDGERSIAGRAALDRLAAAIASRDAALEMQRSAWGRNIREREAAEAALERAEQERDDLSESLNRQRQSASQMDGFARGWEARAEKAERALGETNVWLESILALGHDFGGGTQARLTANRAALLPSEGTITEARMLAPDESIAENYNPSEEASDE